MAPSRAGNPCVRGNLEQALWDTDGVILLKVFEFLLPIDVCRLGMTCVEGMTQCGLNSEVLPSVAVDNWWLAQTVDRLMRSRILYREGDRVIDFGCGNGLQRRKRKKLRGSKTGQTSAESSGWARMFARACLLCRPLNNFADHLPVQISTNGQVCIAGETWFSALEVSERCVLEQARYDFRQWQSDTNRSSSFSSSTVADVAAGGHPSSFRSSHVFKRVGHTARLESLHTESRQVLDSAQISVRSTNNTGGHLSFLQSSPNSIAATSGHVATASCHGLSFPRQKARAAAALLQRRRTAACKTYFKDGIGSKRSQVVAKVKARRRDVRTSTTVNPGAQLWSGADELVRRSCVRGSAEESNLDGSGREETTDSRKSGGFSGVEPGDPEKIGLAEKKMGLASVPQSLNDPERVAVEILQLLCSSGESATNEGGETDWTCWDWSNNREVCKDQVVHSTEASGPGSKLALKLVKRQHLPVCTPPIAPRPSRVRENGSSDNAWHSGPFAHGNREASIIQCVGACGSIAQLAAEYIPVGVEAIQQQFNEAEFVFPRLTVQLVMYFVCLMAVVHSSDICEACCGSGRIASPAAILNAAADLAYLLTYEARRNSLPSNELAIDFVLRRVLRQLAAAEKSLQLNRNPLRSETAAAPVVAPQLYLDVVDGWSSGVHSLLHRALPAGLERAGFLFYRGIGAMYAAERHARALQLAAKQFFADGYGLAQPFRLSDAAAVGQPGSGAAAWTSTGSITPSRCTCAWDEVYGSRPACWLHGMPIVSAAPTRRPTAVSLPVVTRASSCVVIWDRRLFPSISLLCSIIPLALRRAACDTVRNLIFGHSNAFRCHCGSDVFVMQFSLRDPWCPRQLHVVLLQELVFFFESKRPEITGDCTPG